MKKRFYQILLLTFFALFIFTSCQDESIDINNPDDQETILPNSVLANLMLNTSSNDGSLDDILDNANCIAVNLPVTVIVNGVTITINTLEDLELITQIFNEFENDEDILELLFPITIILNDYTEVIITSQEEFETFVEECTEDEDVIECVDFQYPISFSLYNADFQVTDTVVIENDEALYEFLQSLENSNDGVVLASLNFPVTLVYANGNTIEVNSNQELEAAINEAEEDCDEVEENCSEDYVAINLKECFWRVVSFNGDDNFIAYEFHFNNNGTLEIIDGNTTAAIGGNWENSLSSTGLPEIVISNLTAFADDLEGSWIVVECDDDRFELLRETDVSTTAIVIEQECSTNVNECDFGDIQNYLIDCPQIPTLNGYTPSLTTFNFLNTNQLSSLFEGDVLFNGTWDIALIEGQIKVFINFNGLEDYNGEYVVVECGSEHLVLQEGDKTLVLSKQCNNENPFECFEDLTYTICDDDTNDGHSEFDLNAIYNCSADNIDYTFHETIADAENSVNPLVSPYSNVTNPQTLYVRVELAGNPNEFQIFEVQIIVEDCSTGSSCSEAEVDAYLVECHWNVVNYNGSNDLIIYNLDFEQNSGIVVIYNDNTTIDASWSTTQNADGVWVEFSNVNGANIQAISGNWLVVECNEERLKLVKDNDIMVIERDCN